MCDDPASTEILGYEWKDGYHADEWPCENFWWAYNPANPCVAANNNYKLWMATTTTYNLDYGHEKCKAKEDVLWDQSPGDGHIFNKQLHGCNDTMFTGVCFGGASPKMLVAYTDNYGANETDTWGLHARRTTNAGGSFLPSQETDGAPVFPDYQGIYPTRWPSLAVGTGETVYVVYRAPFTQIIFERSANSGESWPQTGVTLGYGDRPCIAAVGSFVFVCWQGEDDKIRYRYSTQSGSSQTWSDAASINGSAAGEYTHPNVSAIACNNQPGVLFTCQCHLPSGKWFVLSKFGRLVVTQSSSYIVWQSNVVTSDIYTQDPGELRPSVATTYRNEVSSPFGAQVFNYPCPGTHRSIDLRYGQWKYFTYTPGGGGGNAGTGRLIARDPDGSMQYAAASRPHIVSGPADTDLLPGLVAPGGQPALALDGDGEPWIAYIYGDTVWTKTGDGSYEVVFAGSNSAVPGQPSIVCYPGQAGGVHVANVVFAVYDTAGGASKIMYARVDTGAVVLDTIESVANLGDSLPCINVYKTDSLLVTWQHGDSTLGSMLCDYGPGTAGQVPAWTSPSLVSANSYHAMSAFDEGGSVLNCVWTRNNGSNYAIQRASCDLASAAFGNWTPMATPGDTGSAEKANPVFAGLGVSCWEEEDVTGEWIIKGYVRGEEETFVANDTDAYHPHAVAESSAVSPSIDQIRVHLLYTAGVTFEVDSGVYDTGEARYVCESLNVSHAGSDATKYNNGTKLLRKAGSDSLLAVYADQDGAVMYAYSATGDTWQREVLATGRESPAIAEDSTGTRWVVVTKPFLGMGSSVQEAYYRSGSSWVGPETLYTNAVVTLGPASLAGASDTSTGIAYAAFLTTSGMSKSLILAKFNGSTVSTYTVATGASLGDPTLTVEPYLADSDRVHVSWEDDGVIKYRMDTDGRSTSIASNWTSVVTLSDAQVVSHHPCISADRDQIVAAWSQVTTTDIHCRKRSTDSAYNNWEAAANLSNTAENASDYPTIAMGDTVVVAWGELRTGGSDFDILASIDFGDTLNVADNATFSTYPHILFQNKASGDTAIPYLHTVWSESPSANYYEVGYNKLNLKQATGEGQQSAGTPPIPVKPSLSACRPNPFRDRTQISYALPTSGNVNLRVYDVMGRTVRTLANGHQKAGSYSVTWDSKDSRGRQVARGVYFYRLDTPGFRSVKKAVVTR
jgi:hypothetical protein